MSEADSTRVVIADADRSSRAGVRLSLNAGGFDVCAEADDADTAVACARRERPDVCLVEPELSGDGIAAAARIVAEVPGTAVVMLGRDVDDDLLLEAVLAGARGYLLKDMDPARLPQTLHGVLNGEAAMPRRLVSRMLEGLRKREQGVHAARLGSLGVDLTRRETDVLELLDRGLATREIAAELSISPTTVRRHISEILRKLAVPDRASALRAVRASGD